MQSVLRNVRVVVFGAAVLGSLGFGASQAVASPGARSACDGPDQVYVGYCPSKTQCGQYCASGIGTCESMNPGCCRCAI
jgi:hypothetical protein